MHRLLIIGCAHADADIGIYVLVAMTRHPVHCHVGAATVGNQHDMPGTGLAQVFDGRLDARHGLGEERYVIVIFGFLAQHRQLQRQGMPAAGRQRGAQGGHHIRPVGMHAAPVQDDRRAARVAQGGGIVDGKKLLCARVEPDRLAFHDHVDDFIGQPFFPFQVGGRSVECEEEEEKCNQNVSHVR